MRDNITAIYYQQGRILELGFKPGTKVSPPFSQIERDHTPGSLRRVLLSVYNIAMQCDSTGNHIGVET